MSTNRLDAGVAVLQEPAQPAKPKAEKGSRSFSITMTGDAGTLKVTAQRKRDGTATTFAVLTVKDGKKKVNTRGASSQHADLDRAKGAAERLAVEASKKGWVRRERRAAGFVAQPDQFTATTLPSASKPSKK